MKTKSSESLAPSSGTTFREPYSGLAPLYDRIMAHVDYDNWASYLVSLCSQFNPSPQRILELGCGTGNLTLRLADRLSDDYLATDSSDEMLAIAKRKAGAFRSNLTFDNVDFRRLDIDGTFDVVILAYDGINYVLESDLVVSIMDRVSFLLNPGGIFLFDQSAPANSINNLAYFDDRWDTVRASYSRKSEYDRESRLHVTRFDIRIGKKHMQEVHVQRAYELQEMEMMLKLSSLRVERCMDAFTFAPATSESERIQWVLARRSPPTNSLTG